MKAPRGWHALLDSLPEDTTPTPEAIERCPHSTKGIAPSECSMCRGVPVKRITVINHALCEDGRPTGRAFDDEPRQRMALMKKRRPR